MKTIASMMAASFLFMGCAGAGGDGLIAYPSGGRASGGDDSVAPKARVATETPSREVLGGGLRAPRHDVDYLVCAQCRR